MTLRSHPYAVTLEQDALTHPALASLRQAAPRGRYRAVVAEGDAQARSALESTGFVLVRHTWEGWVRLADANRKAFALAHEYVRDMGLTVGPLVPKALDGWLRAHERAYRRCHTANPLAPLDDAGRYAMFADDLRPEAAFVVMDGAHVLAHASLREDEDGWAFGWFGAEPRAPVDPDQMNRALKHLELTQAERLGLTAVWVERDSTDPQAMALNTDLPIAKARVWMTYQTEARFAPA